MGNLLQKIATAVKNRWCPEDHQVIMCGLDAVGKTTVMYRLKQDAAVVETVPSCMGFQYTEKVKYKTMTINAWDVGGSTRLRPLYRHYYVGAEALIFIVDSVDVERIEQASTELHRMLGEPDLANAKVLILANKQDLPNALETPELVTKLGLGRIQQYWCIVGCSAYKHTGVYEGFDWLNLILTQKPTLG